MWWIGRMYLDGVGHSESFYKNITLDFGQDGDSNSLNHTYLQLVNGGGKTTLVSLMLTLFEPDKRQFVQVISGRDKGMKYSYDDYFHRELSVLLIELVNKNGDSLLIGQFHQKNGDETDVIKFMCDDQSLIERPFDIVPSRTRALDNPHMKPYVGSIKQARAWLSEMTSQPEGFRWRVLPTNQEWRAALREHKVNHDMIKTMITFNAEEGGISNFAHYKSEQDFLASFYGCVIPKDQLASLIASCRHEIAENGELNTYRRDLEFYQQVLSRWQRFNAPASLLLQHRREKDNIIDQFQIYLRDLEAHKDKLGKMIEERDGQIKSKNDSLDELNKEADALKLREFELKYQLASLQLEMANQKVAEIDASIVEAKGQADVFKAALPHKEWQSIMHRITRLNEDIRILNEQHEKPMQVRFDNIAAQSKRVHLNCISASEAERDELAKNVKSMNEAIADSNKAMSALQRQQGELAAERRTLRGAKEQGELQLDDLKQKGLIESNESPENSLLRWDQLMSTHQADAEVTEQKLAVCETTLESLKANQQKCEVDKSTAGQLLSRAQDQHESAKTSFNNLNQLWHNLPSSLEAKLNAPCPVWTQKGAKAQLESWIQDFNADHERLSQDQYALRAEFNALESAGNTLIDADLNRALTALYDKGVKRDRLWAYPTYLSEMLQDDPERIAAKIESNPGRYMGLVALDDNTLEQVRGVSADLEWSHQPIPVYLLNESDVTPVSGADERVPDAVIAPSKKLIYSSTAYEKRLQELNDQIETNNKAFQAMSGELEALRQLLSQWTVFYQQYGSHWDDIIEAVNQAELRQKESEAALDEARRATDAYKKTLADAKHLAQQALKQVQATIEQKRTLEWFLEGSWKQVRHAQQRLPAIETEVKSINDKIARLNTDITRSNEALHDAQANHTQIINLIRKLKNRLNSSLYASVSPVNEAEAIAETDPDLIHQEVDRAQHDLEQARMNKDVIALKQELQNEESNLKKALTQLEAHKAWETHQTEVESASAKSHDSIMESLDRLSANLDRLDVQYRAESIQQLKLKEDYDLLVQSRPDKPVELDSALLGDEEGLHQALIATQTQRRTTQQAQRCLRDEIEKLYEASNELSGKLTKTNALIIKVEAVHSSPANGIEQPINRLEDLESEIKIQKQAYDKVTNDLVGDQKQTAHYWNQLNDHILLELTRPEEEQAASMFVTQWQKHSMESALDQLEGVGRSIEDNHACTQNLIERIREGMDLAVQDLGGHLSNAMSLLRKASKVKIPTQSPVLPGKHVMKIRADMDLMGVDFESKARECLERWIEKGDVPVVPGQRDMVTAELVQSIYPEGNMEIALIKTTTTTVNTRYTPITALEGSGGQLLTTSFLLFVMVSEIQCKDNDLPTDGFLIADNPLGKCNADSLIKIQLAMAKAYNIQLIYMSGLTDPNAKAMFENHIMLTRIGRLKDRAVIGFDEVDDHMLFSTDLKNCSEQVKGALIGQ